MTSIPRILIVDDEQGLRDAMRTWFTARGFETDEAEDGLVAIEKCAQNRYDVVTMDLSMPRMTGIEAIAVIKERHPDMPIVVFTGYPEEFDLSSLPPGVEVLTKPLGLRVLEEEVRRLLPEAQPEG